MTRRKEVVVGNQVFDLGLKELAETVANRDGKLLTLDLEVGDTELGLWSRKRPSS